MQEIWKDIDWYEWKYQISNLGKVKSFKDTKVKILVASEERWWYLKVNLSKWDKIKQFKVHRLVLQYFAKTPKLECNHKNWVRWDNRIKNLEWVTRSENERHKYDVLWYKWPNKWKTWKLSNCSIKVDQYTKTWKFIKTWESMSNVYRDLNIYSSEISKVCRWKRKTTWWFIWKYNQT
jgi:hypothetical protein